MNRYKQIREKRRLTQKEVSEQLHVTQGSISQWENGRTNPDYKTLVKLSEIYDVPVDYLVGASESTAKHPWQGGSYTNVSIPRLCELNEAGQKMVNEFVDFLASKDDYLVKKKFVCVQQSKK